MTIKHLILPGGSVNGIQTLGILCKLSEYQFFNMDDIQSIYATSIGSFIAVLLALRFSFDDITDYIIKRPWHETIPFTVSNVFDLINEKGFYGGLLYQIFLSLSLTPKTYQSKLLWPSFINLLKSICISLP